MTVAAQRNPATELNPERVIVRSHASAQPVQLAFSAGRSARGRSRDTQRRDLERHVLEHDLFKGVLLRERRRADRSNQPLALLVVERREIPGVAAHEWDAVIEALTAATRDADVLGWVEKPAVLGVLLTEVTAPSATFANHIGTRVRRELAKRLDTKAFSRFSIRLHVDPEATTSREGVDAPRLQFDRHDDRRTPYDALKRCLDIVGSLMLLVALSPLLLLIAALVKLKSPGPVFFRQVRVGRMMKPFTMLKFRTMHLNADHAIHHEFVTSFIKSGSNTGEAGANAFFKITDDPRVTPVGRILRSTSLDELPQLWNVLRGEMSLVGPRPPLPYEFEQYRTWHQRRVFEAKPGMTGLWQVAGRSRTTFDDMVRLDLRYARRRSLWTDLKILLATPAAVISGKGAC